MDALSAYLPTSFGKMKAVKNEASLQYEKAKRSVNQDVKAEVRAQKVDRSTAP